MWEERWRGNQRTLDARSIWEGGGASLAGCSSAMGPGSLTLAREPSGRGALLPVASRADLSGDDRVLTVTDWVATAVCGLTNMTSWVSVISMWLLSNTELSGF